MKRARHIPITGALLLVVATIAPMACVHAQGAGGGVANPVYTDDSTAAREAQPRVRELLNAGNTDEAVRVLQRLLDEQGDRVVESEADRDVSISVRARVMSLIASEPRLLERYRAISTPGAQALLAERKYEELERAHLLTEPGFEAALRIAQTFIEAADFEAARLTLEQLEAHPDSTGPHGAQAAALWTLLEHYLDRPRVHEVASRWRKGAAASGVSQPAQASPKPVEWPAAALVQGLSATSPLPALDTQGLVSKPLWSVQYAPKPRGPEQAAINRGGRMLPNPPTAARELGVIPSFVGDLLIINDGLNISAWDRFTLTPRWNATPGGADPAAAFDPFQRRDRFGWGMQSSGEDPTTITADGRTLVASTGRNPASGRDGDNRISAFDLTSGRLLWSTTLDAVDPNLADAAVRGPVELVGSTAVVPVRKLAGERRLISFGLVGLDIATGAPRWTRTIGSTGSMPWVMQSSGAEACASDRGLIYRGDRLGVICALEAHSGRVRWVRRLPVDPNNQADPPKAYQFAQPIIDADTLVTLSPDGHHILRLNQNTGEIVARRPTPELGAPQAVYIVRVGTFLAGVNDENAHFVPLASFQSADPEHSPRLTDDPGVRGRVLAAGNKLLIPTLKGVQIVDPASPAKPDELDLDAPGNVLALESQVVVVDESRVHSFLRWDAAQAILLKRIDADPADPQPATTLAELAFRAGKLDRIAGAVLQAVQALEKSSLARDSAEYQALHDRLFEVIHTMVRQSIEPDVAIAASPVGDQVLLGQLIERLGALARRPDQRVAHVLASGRLAQSAQPPSLDRAVGFYQSVLLDPAMSQANWRGSGVSIRAELEASRRLEDLIRTAGPSVYQAPESAAKRELDALGATPTPQQLQSLAQRYPFASHTPSLWSRAARLFKDAGTSREFTAALEAGLRAAQRIPGADPVAVAELGGELVSELRTRGQAGAAAGVLRSIQTAFPNTRLTRSGAPIDIAELSAELAQKIAAGQRWPRVGPVLTEGVQALAGWSIMEPLLRDASPSTPSAIALVSDEQAALFSIDTKPPAPDAQRAPELVRTWTMPLAGKDATLIKLTTQGAFFMFAGEGEVLLASVHAGESEARWTLDMVKNVFPPEDIAGFKPAPGLLAQRFDTPLDRMVSPTDLLVSMDDRTLVLAQRSGRIAGIDIESGEVLWTGRAPLSRAHDCDVNSGWLALCGVVEVIGANGTLTELRPVAQVFDARSGRLWQQAGELSAAPAWVKLTDSGAMIVSSEREIACFDAASGQRNWTLTGEKITPASAAWVMGDHLVLLTPERKLALASIQAGRLRPDPLATPKSLLEGTRIVEVFPLNAGLSAPFGVATQQGVAFFSPEGALLGADALGGSTALVPPQPAENRALAIETVSEGRAGEGTMFFSLLSFETPTGIASDRQTIILGARPSDLVLMDHRVVVSAGGVTVIMPAPAAKPAQP